jgi:hypothetical protein
MAVVGGRSLARLTGATLAAAALSGVPSTVHAVATGRNPLGAARAAGALVPGRRPGVVRGAAAHLSISTFWTVVLALVLPRRGAAAWGALAGLGIAGLDLGIVGRRYPSIAALPTVPQVLDHVAFGAIVGAVLASGSPTTDDR